MNLKPGFLGSQRPGEAENFVRYQTRWGNGMSNLKKIGKLRCKVAKKKETQIRETVKMPCTIYNNTKTASKKKGENEGKYKGCPISKKSGKKTQNDVPQKLERWIN